MSSPPIDRVTDGTPTMRVSAMRVARPTVDLARMRFFYEHVVGLHLLWQFIDHDGFDGAIFGVPDERAQLELVQSPHGLAPSPTSEDALVLYSAPGHELDGLLGRLGGAGTLELPAEDATLNPYWPRAGARCFVDPDGYRLIVVRTSQGQPAGRRSLRVVPSGTERDAYLPLFHLADDSVAEVRAYYQTGTLFGLEQDSGDPIGLILAIPAGPDCTELKAVAVDPSLQGQGVGSSLLRAVLRLLREQGLRRVVVGTSSSGIGQLAYYQKAGFRLWKIERDVFTPARGYPEGIRENGIPLRDMVWLDQELDE
jgi:ribosomal protein S18 acetylase RimI-like enzyme